MTQEQIEALAAANATELTTFPALDDALLYKVIGGDWGNNYGHIVAQDENLQTVSVELIGQGVTIDAERAALVVVPFIGA